MVEQPAEATGIVAKQSFAVPGWRVGGQQFAHAFLVIDVAVTVALLMTMMVLLAMAARQVASVQGDSDARRVLRLAAQTELSRLRAGGTPSASGVAAVEPRPLESATRPVGSLIIETTVRPGQGVWDGFLHVRVVARKQVQGYWARVELSAYLPRREVPP